MELIKNMIVSWWQRFTMSSDEIYLSRAVDVADLERRLKNIINGQHSNIKGA